LEDTFANRLQTAMTLRDISAAELARITETPESVVSQYRSGRYKPRQKRLERMAEALRVSIPWLMGCDVPMVETKPWAEFVNSEEGRTLERLSGAQEGVVAILAEMFNGAELKFVHQLGTRFETSYYWLGRDANAFALHDKDVKDLHEAAKSLFAPLVERIKDSRPEAEIIDELQHPSEGEIAFLQERHALWAKAMKMEDEYE